MLLLLMPKFPSVANALNVSDITQSANAFDVTPPYNATATISLAFANDGRLSYSITTSPSTIGNGTFYKSQEWLTGSPVATTIADDYEIRATLVSGSTPSSGTMNTWLNLGTTRVWSNTVSRTTVGVASRQSVIDFEIGRAGTNTALVTMRADITAYAETSL